MLRAFTNKFNLKSLVSKWILYRSRKKKVNTVTEMLLSKTFDKNYEQLKDTGGGGNTMSLNEEKLK